MATFFENNPNVGKFFVTNFNIDFLGQQESYFDIGFFPTDEAAEEPFCVALLPKAAEARLDPGKITPNQPLANFTLWWQYEVDHFRIGDRRSSGTAQTFVDDGTTQVLGNFADIFSPDPVPDDLCQYLRETNSSFEVVPPSSSGGQRPTTSLRYEDVFAEDGGDGEPLCFLLHVPEFPETLIISGLPFYNKYLIKHDYENERVCFATKGIYLPVHRMPPPPPPGEGIGGATAAPAGGDDGKTRTASSAGFFGGSNIESLAAAAAAAAFNAAWLSL